MEIENIIARIVASIVALISFWYGLKYGLKKSRGEDVEKKLTKRDKIILLGLILWIVGFFSILFLV